jgi:hypothetical protein
MKDPIDNRGREVVRVEQHLSEELEDIFVHTINHILCCYKCAYITLCLMGRVKILFTPFK